MGIGFSDKLFHEADNRDVRVALKLWMEELNQQMGFNYNPNAIIFDDVESVLQAILDQKIGMIALHTFDYFALKNRIDLEPFLVTNRGGLTTESYLLLVRKDQGFKELKDLEGKQLLIPSGGTGLIPKTWLNSLLKRNGLPEKNTFFNNSREVNKSLHSILPVFFKQADCCVVSSNDFETMKELNPQLESELFIIARSPSYLRSVFCFTKNFSLQEKNDILSVTFKLDSYARGRQILALFRFDGILPFKPENIENVESLYEEYRNISNQ
jgi:ABC-type phosphate/phosphonate transport system substrate-binding protein